MTKKDDYSEFLTTLSPEMKGKAGGMAAYAFPEGRPPVARANKCQKCGKPIVNDPAEWTDGRSRYWHGHCRPGRDVGGVLFKPDSIISCTVFMLGSGSTILEVKMYVDTDSYAELSSAHLGRDRITLNVADLTRQRDMLCLGEFYIVGLTIESNLDYPTKATVTLRCDKPLEWRPLGYE